MKARRTRITNQILAAILVAGAPAAALSISLTPSVAHAEQHPEHKAAMDEFEIIIKVKDKAEFAKHLDAAEGHVRTLHKAFPHETSEHALALMADARKLILEAKIDEARAKILEAKAQLAKHPKAA